MQEVEDAVGEDDRGARRRARPRTKRSRPGVEVAALMTRVLLEPHVAGEPPGVARTVDADVLGPRLHAEGVEQAVVVVRIAVDLVDRDVELVGAFDEVERVDGEGGLGVAGQALGRQLLDVGVGAVAADAFGVEQAEADDEVVDRQRRAHADRHVEPLARLEDVPAARRRRR